MEKGPLLLVIDTSGSMKGEKIEGVKESVTRIIESLRPEQAIGIFAFNSKVNLFLSPTLDKASALNKVSQINASGDTSLYDAILESINFESTPRPSQIVILSDGVDTTSDNSLATLIKQSSTSGIQINAIGVNVTREQETILSSIAKSAGGGYFSVGDISKLLDTYTLILGDQLMPSPTSVSSQNQVNSELSKTTTSTLFEVISSILVATLVLLLFLNLRRRSIKKEHQKARLFVLQKYSYKDARKLPSKLRISIESYNFVPTRVENWVKAKIDLIHSDYTYHSVIRTLLFLTLIASVLFSLLLQNIFLGIAFSVFFVPLGFNSYVNSIRNKQISRFSEELPELLNILASALKAGLTLPQGLEAYSTDSNGEVARQIRRAIGEIRVGTPIDEALMGVAERMESEDLRWAVTALSIQRIVGGSMATILTTTYETVQSRAEIRREVKTLAAEGKLSAYVLMALPIGIFSFLFLTRREYVSAFWNSTGGVMLSILVILALSFGWFWMKKIIEIKI